MKKSIIGWAAVTWIGIAGSVLIFIWLWIRPATVLVKWETATELDMIGFYITRSENPDGPFERVTDTLIPAQTDAFTGGTYQYKDTGLKAGSTYHYQLEAVSTQGDVERFGPLKVQVNRLNAWDGLLSVLPALSGVIIGLILAPPSKKLWLGPNLVLLQIDNSRLLKTLTNHYQEFVTPRGKPDVITEITSHHSKERNIGDGEPNVSLSPSGVWLLQTKGFQGQFDLQKRKASLDLASMQQAFDVDFFLRILTLGLAYQQGGLLIHAAGIVRDGDAYVFLGHSGTGKTTCARLSAELPNVQVMNDDLVMLLPDASGWKVFSTPFWNLTQIKPGLPGQGMRLRKMYRLVQDEIVQIETISQAVAIAEITACVPAFGRLPEDIRSVLWKRIQMLAQTPGIERLHFRKDASFWNVIDERFSL